MTYRYLWWHVFEWNSDEGNGEKEEIGGGELGRFRLRSELAKSSEATLLNSLRRYYRKGIFSMDVECDIVIR